jgi:2-keto-4-pentenoate hydratase
MLIANHDEVNFSQVMSPKAEPEIALILEHDLVVPQATIVDVMRACAFVLPALEITGSRFTDGQATVVDDIADNCGAGLFVIGARPIPLVDAVLGETQIVVERRGERSVAGVALASIDRALAATAWLAEKMALERTPLRAGDTVMTGAITDDVALSAGDRVEVLISGLESVSVTLIDDRRPQLEVNHQEY